MGVREIEVKTAGVTVSSAVPLTLFRVAVIELVPEVAPFANPPLLIVATDVVEELHLATLVRFRVVPLLYVPVALNC